jgi:hypothetical protein
MVTRRRLDKLEERLGTARYSACPKCKGVMPIVLLEGTRAANHVSD